MQMSLNFDLEMFTFLYKYLLTCCGGPEMSDFFVQGASSMLNVVLKCLILCTGGIFSTDVV